MTNAKTTTMTAAATVDQTLPHYVIADASGHGCGGKVTVRRIVQTREEAVAYVAKRKDLQAWRDTGGECTWRVGSRFALGSSWRTEIRGGWALPQTKPFCNVVQPRYLIR